MGIEGFGVTTMKYVLWWIRTGRSLKQDSYRNNKQDFIMYRPTWRTVKQHKSPGSHRRILAETFELKLVTDSGCDWKIPLMLPVTNRLSLSSHEVRSFHTERWFYLHQPAFSQESQQTAPEVELNQSATLPGTAIFYCLLSCWGRSKLLCFLQHPFPPLKGDWMLGQDNHRLRCKTAGR